jgi:hypothetical protein
MKTYNTIFLALVLFIVCMSAAIMLWSQPISGDLTRISAYPERWFGWNEPQQDIPSVINYTAPSWQKTHSGYRRFFFRSWALAISFER